MGEVVPISTKQPDKKRNVYVRNVSDVKRLINNTINELRTGELDSKKANAIGYLANILLKVFETETVVDKLAAMEERLKAIDRKDV